MKIGFDAKRAFNNAAGLGNFSRNTINALYSEYPNDKYYLFNPGSKKQLFINPEKTIVVKPEGLVWKNLKKAWRTYHITKLASSIELDIYHGLSHELPAGIENTDIKTVVTMHDLIFLRYPEYFKRADRIIYERKFRHACRIADQIHAISNQTKDDLVNYLDVNEKKIKVIYQSINPIFNVSSDSELRKIIASKYNLPEKFILTVGTVEARKNLLRLLQGMGLANIEIPLVVVGKPTEYQNIAQKFIFSETKKLNVIFLKDVQDDELAELYRMAEIMIYPSVFEGFGLPVAEAQASGCPVITSNRSSMPEAGGDAAIYVNPENPFEIGNAIETLLNDKIIRQSMIEKGIVNSQRFTMKIMANELKLMYNNLING